MLKTEQGVFCNALGAQECGCHIFTRQGAGPAGEQDASRHDRHDNGR